MLHLALLLQMTAPAPAIVAVPSKAGSIAAEIPCRIKDRRGRLINFDRKFCEALADYTSPPAPAADPPPHTLLQLVVDRSGKVETCSVLESSGMPHLDAKSCSIAIDKALYAAASATGKMRRQTTRLRIDWPRSLPVRTLAPPPIAHPTSLQPAAVPTRPIKAELSRASEPVDLSYEQRLAAQQGVRGREPTQGWTIGD